MEEFDDQFIRRVVEVASTKSPSLCKRVIKLLVQGDHVGIKELLPEIFE